MQVERFRNEALAGKRNDLTQTIRSLRRSKRALRSVTNIISKNTGLSPLLNSSFDSENTPPPGSDESAGLEHDDIASFSEASIPFPVIHDDDTKLASKPLRHLSQPPKQPPDTSSADATAGEAAVTSSLDPASSSQPMTITETRRSSSELSDVDADEARPITYEQEAVNQPDEPGVPPDKVAPPQPEEEAEFDDATQELLDHDSPERPARVVHLPEEEDGDELGADGKDEGRSSDDTNQTRPSRTRSQAQTEHASSPSSTVDAHSAATPMPAQDSPDTSPDSEHADQSEVLPPKDLRPSPEEQRQKEEHDRLLEAQKEIARRNALGDVSSADDQLRYEEREAAARDAEETAARQESNGPEANAKLPRGETEAEEVMEDIEEDNEGVEERASVPDKSAGEEVDKVKERSESQAAEDEDGDNITVTPRTRVPLTIDTSRSQQAAVLANGQPTPGEQERMTTRTSSGALQKRSVSEILGQTPSRRDFASPDGISPMAARHQHDVSIAAPSSSTTATHMQRRQDRHPMGRTPGNPQTALEDLIALKGAADDPDRDYLEPLFRIQAHDSPNVRTTALPDLVRSASKAISTEDQFSTLHERLDYRILRRVYHLQNANKWSLRQMEKCKEPEQPVTHHDHMMAEMQWMRKDFKQERKMKKSVCAWLATRCADWVAASAEERKKMQIQVSSPKVKADVDAEIDEVQEQDEEPSQSDEVDEEQPPELEHSGESAPEDDAGPPTPRLGEAIASVVIPPDLSDSVKALDKSGQLDKMLKTLPIVGLSTFAKQASQKPALTPVSKFVGSKVLPTSKGPPRKRSRFDFEDDNDTVDAEPNSKRLREEHDLPPEDQDMALFHPDNKPIRDRLHANNAFRPPSEFVMPSTPFYEFRNGSQWIWEDDQKLRKLAKEYSFNWSLISDELQLPGIYKSSAERRTPWECFERWVELEQLPTEMRKTMYFKTWYSRLEQSQQAAERRYQAQVAALQASTNGQAQHVPMRRRTVPTRVEKRKNTRYLWMVDAMRKLARKKEQQAYKQAEAQRAAAQRKSQTDNSAPRQQMLTPQEFSRKRWEADQRMAEAQRLHRQKQDEARQRAAMAQRAAQQGMPNGNPAQQRPGSSSNMPGQQAQMQPNGQQQPNMAGQMAQQGRHGVPMATTRNGHLAVPQMNGQAIPQAQMRPNGQMPTAQEMQRLAQANAQARSGQYGAQQQYQVPNANMMSPGSGGMTAQQQLHSSQQMLASMQQQMGNAGQHQGSPHGSHQMSASPNMPPPPTPQNQAQSLSSGHVPMVEHIKQQVRAKYPNHTEDQVTRVATDWLKNHSQSTSQARQNAMNAAAGINGGAATGNNMQNYAHNQVSYQNNQQVPNGNANSMMNGDTNAQQQQLNTMQYATLMRQRQMAQMGVQQSPNSTHATLNGSPSLTHASPNLAPVSPNMQYSNMNQMAGMNAQQQRPPSRSATPQMQRLGSSGNMQAGMPSPQGVNGLQGSPRNMQASMAR